MTIKSDIYSKKINLLSPNMHVTSLACPKFVPIVESNETETVVAKKIVYETLQPLVGKVDTLILGCTHYPLLRNLIQNVMGHQVRLIDSGAETVRDISVLLNYFLINGEVRKEIHHRFYTTASVEAFEDIANVWLGSSVHAEHVKVD